tara:strand:+ start:37 stop:1230 length:1194 start_codon:yes stop_codon:yes gene_type:complete
MDNIKLDFQKHIDAGRCNGAEWIINYKNKRYHEVIGFNDLNSQDKLKKNSYYRIWSMTKPIIGFAAMQLIEKKFLSLDDTIDKYLPKFKNLKKLQSLTSKINETKQVDNIPTIRQLLQHTAGFTYNSSNNFLAEAYENNKLFHSSSRSLEEEIDSISDLPLLYEPGLNWHYSISIDILARILEVVTKDKLLNILKENIFFPLEMNETNFFISEDKNKNLVETFEYNSVKSKLTELNFDKRKLILYGYPTNNENFSRGGHGLYSTAEDYIKFAKMLVDGKDKNAKPLVNLETLKLIRTNSLSKNLFPIEITAVNTVKDEHYENDLDGYGWGLGFRVLMNNTAQNKYGVIGEFGWSGYAATYFLVDPINDLSAVLMMQILDADKNIKKDFYNNIFKSFT